jgi:hypothetical protein
MTQFTVVFDETHIPPDIWVQPIRADLRRRLIEATLVIARTPGATSLDVQEALSPVWNRPARDRSIQRTLAELPRYDLAYRTVQPIIRQQQLGLIRLTERGRTLARSLDVEPVENGWDTLVRTHQGEAQVAHAALLLYTDRLAREHGWLTELTPDESHQQFYPDLWLSTGEWSMYVEVESRWRARSHQWDKWRAAQRAQGFAAIVARTPAVRAKLIQGCRAAGVPGVATDLDTLRRRGTDWWVTCWGTSTTPREMIDFLQRLISA